MNFISNTLQYIDIFGISFQFTTFNKPKFNTTIGGLITVICGLISIMFSLSFGGDFFYRTHPRILSQVVTPKDYLDPIVMTPDNFVLPFRLTGELGNTIEMNNPLYVTVSYLEVQIDNTGTTVKVDKVMNYTKCDSTKVRMKEFTDYRSADDWYCIDLSGYNYTLGGWWDAPYASYLTFTVSLCPLGVPINNQNCSSLEEVKKYLYEQTAYFEILYPEYTLDAESLDQPFRMTFADYFYKLNLNLKKLDRFFFKSGTFEDDRGWIMKDLAYYSTFGFADLKYDIGYVNEDDFGKEGSPSDIYRCFIYTQKKYESTKRYFMKIQELAAILGGFLKIITTIGTYLSVILINLIRDRIIITQLFNQTFNNMKKQNSFNSKMKDLKNNSFTKNIIEMSKIQENQLDNSNSAFKRLSNNSNIIQKENKENITNIMNLNKNERPEKPNENFKLRLDKYNKTFNLKDINLNDSSNQQHNQISLWSLFRINYFGTKKFYLDSNNVITKAMNDYLKEKFDVFHYLQDSESIYKMRYLLLNENQNLCLSLINVFDIQKKVEAENPEGRDSLKNRDLNTFLQYFKNNQDDQINKKYLDILNFD